MPTITWSFENDDTCMKLGITNGDLGCLNRDLTVSLAVDAFPNPLKHF